MSICILKDIFLNFYFDYNIIIYIIFIFIDKKFYLVKKESWENNISFIYYRIYLINCF